MKAGLSYEEEKRVGRGMLESAAYSDAPARVTGLVRHRSAPPPELLISVGLGDAPAFRISRRF